MKTSPMIAGAVDSSEIDYDQLTQLGGKLISTLIKRTPTGGSGGANTQPAPGGNDLMRPSDTGFFGEYGTWNSTPFGGSLKLKTVVIGGGLAALAYYLYQRNKK